MTAADDKLDFCKQALGEIGTRSTITALDPPDGSPESYYCNLFFDSTRDQLLRAAHWGFASRSDVGLLWKALPGTPENPTVPDRYTWSNRDPAPPWRYAYRVLGLGGIFGNGVTQIRRVREQPSASTNSVPGIGFFSESTPFGSFSDGIFGGDRGGCVPFEVGTDRYDRDGNLLEATNGIEGVSPILFGGTAYRAGDYITLIQDGPDILNGQPPIAQVMTVGGPGNALSVRMVEFGTFISWTTADVVQQTTTGVGYGFVGTPIFGANPGIVRVLLTNARNPIVDFTTSDIGVAEYDASFSSALSTALGGKLALALLGDKEMYKNKLQEANLMILEARVRDGNEGLTTYDHVPDWLAVRGVSAMAPRQEWFNPPYGPLFAV
jgi:hypothetical protein